MELEIVKVTKLWIERFVIGLGLCPFAHFSFNDDTIHYDVSSHTKTDHCISDLLEMASLIRSKTENEISNAFLIFDKHLSFIDLLNIKEKFDAEEEQEDHPIVLQSVVFHPDFQFADELFHAHGNFINRSPYGMIHLLRAEEVSRAIDSTPGVEEIPYRNKRHLEKIKMSNISKVFDEDFVEQNAP